MIPRHLSVLLTSAKQLDGEFADLKLLGPNPKDPKAFPSCIPSCWFHLLLSSNRSVPSGKTSASVSRGGQMTSQSENYCMDCLVGFFCGTPKSITALHFPAFKDSKEIILLSKTSQVCIIPVPKIEPN
jgi:hypothetical protein